MTKPMCQAWRAQTYEQTPAKNEGRSGLQKSIERQKAGGVRTRPSALVRGPRLAPPCAPTPAEQAKARLQLVLQAAGILSL
ncbi:hypothetical protein ROHU_033014 [Labeo rohita]|uniref:Uncharacterized protein n=1 Tax=Labeo rohita TaxID=84645 RepID=A0A498LCR2_LABRO|nr:hypothetical protein ROHU_033014 [Labeo rohita]